MRIRLTTALVVAAAVAAIAVPTALALAFVDSVKPPDGTQGTPYSFQFSAHSGCPPYRYAILSGSLPPGLTLSSEGVISGTPTTPGSYSFWAGLGDTCVTPETGSQRPFTINIAPHLKVSTTALPPVTVGVPYSFKLAAEGGGTQRWSVSSGTLPAGLTLSQDGTLSGTATAALPAPVSITFLVTDGSRLDHQALNLDVVAPLAATAPTLPTAENGHALGAATLTATGGRQPYTWTATGAPAWLTVNPTTGAISGTPTAAGTFSFQVAVKDAYQATATVNVALTVKAKLAVKTTRLPATRVGKLYHAVLRTNGGVAPITWKVTSGKFPVGIRLNRKTGVLSGTARKAGSYPLTFTVTDAFGETQDVSLTLTVGKKKKV